MHKLTLQLGECLVIGEASRLWVERIDGDHVTLAYEGQILGGERDGERVRVRKSLARFEPMQCGIHLTARWTSKSGNEVRVGLDVPGTVEVWKE